MRKTTKETNNRQKTSALNIWWFAQNEYEAPRWKQLLDKLSLWWSNADGSADTAVGQLAA